MYLYGASGHAKVIIDILESQSETIDGIFDDNKDIKVLSDYPVNQQPEIRSPLIISIGNNKIRKTLADRLGIDSYGTAIHSSVQLSRFSTIEAGTVVMHGAIIQTHVKIGKHCIINTGASIDHDCIIEDYVHISPHATLCGNVTVKEGTHIGAGAIIIPGIKVGRWCVIGAGSVVTKDIPDNVLAVGNRCKVIKEIRYE